MVEPKSLKRFHSDKICGQCVAGELAILIAPTCAMCIFQLVIVAQEKYFKLAFHSEQETGSVPHQAPDERVHGLEPDRASQDHRGDSLDAQRGDLQVSRQKVEDTLPDDTSQIGWNQGLNSLFFDQEERAPYIEEAERAKVKRTGGWKRYSGEYVTVSESKHF